ncbi:hypothetical protein C4588_05480 [Candidatus Parcubacteria bacterium]|nr:MAG: hypothetical protein C4588_05480 [Candidatus Parcubacteria bacterium]
MFKSKNKFYRLKLDYVLLAVVMLIFYGRGQLNHFIGDPDGFYHAKISSLINQGIVLKQLPWMQFSSLKDSFVDHHFLYHIVVAPFTNIVNPLVGIKIATVLLAALMVLIFYWLLKQLNTKYPLAFAMGFLILGGLTFRLYLIKVNSFFLILIWLLIAALINKKPSWLMLLGFAFVWSYGMWPMSILIFVVYILAEKIHNYINTSKVKIFTNKIISIFSHHRSNINLKMFLYLLSGIVLGIVINPYWPQNLHFYRELIFMGLFNSDRSFPVGGEWSGAQLGQIISSAPHIFIIMAILIIILIFNLKKVRKFTWFSFILTLIFFLVTMKSKRYVEYYSPLALLFTASAFTDVLSFINKNKIINWWQSISKFLKIYVTVILTVFLILVLPSVYDKILNPTMHTKYSMDHFKEAATWLANNSPEHSVVFHSDWDEWPILFYYNTHNYYIIGLDPVLIENYDSDLHTLYREITYGNISYDLYHYISDNFKANYVFVDKDGHQRLIQNLIADKHFQEVYRDEQNIIYKIIQ